MVSQDKINKFYELLNIWSKSATTPNADYQARRMAFVNFVRTELSVQEYRELKALLKERMQVASHAYQILIENAEI